MLTLSQRLSVRERMKFVTRTFETLLDLNDKPHLLIAIEVRGANFPHLNSEPFVRVIDKTGRGAKSWIARVAEDGSALTGYFPVDARLAGNVLEFGYGDGVYGRIGRFRASAERLDRERLRVKPVVVTDEVMRKIAKIKTEQDPLFVEHD